MMFRATEIFAGLTVNFLIVCRKNHLECFVSAIPNIEYSKAMHTDFLDSNDRCIKWAAHDYTIQNARNVVLTRVNIFVKIQLQHAMEPKSNR